MAGELSPITARRSFKVEQENIYSGMSTPQSKEPTFEAFNLNQK
jgi:hypothetical protein